MTVLSAVKTTVFGVMLLISSFLGSIFILTPVVPLLFWKPWLYRKISDRIVGFWETLPVALLFNFIGMNCCVTGDKIRNTENSIIVMNHRTRLDWLYFWMCLYRMDLQLLTSEKIVLKSDLKKIPGAGWAMECAAYIFVARQWLSDQPVLVDTVDYLASTGNKYQVLFFPEGTDLCLNAKRRSDEFAQTNGLPQYEYVLHPRVTGFVSLVQRMRQNNFVDSIYDVTIGYPDRIVENELKFFQGYYPDSVSFHVKRYAASDLPESDTSVGQWCQKLWSEKEERLHQFYLSQPKSFKRNEIEPMSALQRCVLTFSLCFWLTTFLLWIWWFFKLWLVRVFVLLSVTFFVVVGQVHGGVERLELYLWKTQMKQP